MDSKTVCGIEEIKKVNRSFNELNVNGNCYKNKF